MRGGNVAGLAIATTCGVLTAYTTLQPELQEEAEKKAGLVPTQQSEKEKGKRDTQLSDAIKEDLRQARQQADEYEGGRFAWGIRKWLFGSRNESVPAQEPAKQPAQETPSKDEKQIAR